MKMEQVSNSCYAVLNEKNRVCDANSGLINVGGGMVIDTQSDLPHAQQMIKMFGKVWPAMPKRVVNSHEDSDHVFGNQRLQRANSCIKQPKERTRMINENISLEIVFKCGHIH